MDSSEKIDRYAKWKGLVIAQEKSDLGAVQK